MLHLQATARTVQQGSTTHGKVNGTVMRVLRAPTARLREQFIRRSTAARGSRNLVHLIHIFQLVSFKKSKTKGTPRRAQSTRATAFHAAQASIHLSQATLVLCARLVSTKKAQE